MEQKTQIFRTVSKYVWTMVKLSHQRRSGVFVNYEYISRFSSASIVDFEQVNISWKDTKTSSNNRDTTARHTVDFEQVFTK